MENTFQKQTRELKEVRFESFKQGVFKERDRIERLIENRIQLLNYDKKLNGTKAVCCQAELMCLKQEINKLTNTKDNK